MSNYFVTPSPIGPLGIQFENEKITRINFLAKETKTTAENTFSKKIKQQLATYFKKPNHAFEIGFELKGTPFQQKVWNAIYKIPKGKTLTYQDIANKLKTSPRAVGNACRANPVPLIVPCHRVVGKNHLGGFAGDTSGKLLAIKKWLLQHEGQGDITNT